MSEFQRMSSERMRLIRFRMRKENLRFADELRLIPRTMVLTVAGLFVAAQVIAQTVNVYNGFELPADFSRTETVLAVAGIVTAVAIPLAALIFLIGYVNRDAKRRGMHTGLWTLLVIIMLPAWLLVGFVIYFLVREPLPYHCTQCGAMVSARFNYCPSCQYNLRPACQNCREEIGESDHYCPHCGSTVAPQVKLPVQS